MDNYFYNMAVKVPTKISHGHLDGRHTTELCTLEDCTQVLNFGPFG